MSVMVKVIFLRPWTLVSTSRTQRFSGAWGYTECDPVEFICISSGDSLGQAIASGDVNGDLFDDFLVAAPYQGGEPRAGLCDFRGARAGFRWRRGSLTVKTTARMISTPEQEDFDADGIGNPCDYCPFDPFNDIDTDSFCGNVDNCPWIF